MMTTPRARSTSTLRWIFTRNDAALTCALGANAAGGYDVCVVPHWDVSSGGMERFDAPAAALHRHAELARYLLDTGWRHARGHSDYLHAA